MKELALMASDEALYTVLDAIRDALSEHGWEDEPTTQILISAEEIFVNIAHYAYGGESKEAWVKIDADENRCILEFRDKGKPYNPLLKEDPDITLSADEREIGGLGIFMVKEFMDREDHRFEDGQNIFTVEKKRP